MDQCKHTERGRTRVRGRTGCAARTANRANPTNLRCRRLGTATLPMAAHWWHWAHTRNSLRSLTDKVSDQDASANGSNFFNSSSLRNWDIATGRYSAMIFSVIVAYPALK